MEFRRFRVQGSGGLGRGFAVKGSVRWVCVLEKNFGGIRTGLSSKSQAATTRTCEQLGDGSGIVSMLSRPCPGRSSGKFDRAPSNRPQPPRPSPLPQLTG